MIPGSAQALIAELHDQDQKANEGFSLLVVALRHELITIAPTPDALQCLEEHLREGGIPLGFILIVSGTGGYQLKHVLLPERADDKTALGLLADLGRQVADTFERDEGGYIERPKDGPL